MNIIVFNYDVNFPQDFKEQGKSKNKRNDGNEGWYFSQKRHREKNYTIFVDAIKFAHGHR